MAFWLLWLFGSCWTSLGLWAFLCATHFLYTSCHPLLLSLLLWYVDDLHLQLGRIRLWGEERREKKNKTRKRKRKRKKQASKKSGTLFKVARTQKNKATAKHLGDLKAKLCAARRDARSAMGKGWKSTRASKELIAPEKSGGGKSKGFEAWVSAAHELGWSGPKIWRFEGCFDRFPLGRGLSAWTRASCMRAFVATVRCTCRIV